MLTVHHLSVSQSDRLIWLCEELSIPYDLKVYKRDPLLAPPDYAALHPLSAAPVIQDGPNITIAESAACVEYIIHTHGGGRLSIAPGKQNYADYLYWFHFANGTLQPAVSRNMVLRLSGLKADTNPVVARLETKLAQVLSFMDQRLQKCEWLAGDVFTAADVMAVTSLTTMRSFYGYDLGPYLGLLGWLGRVKGREAWRVAMGKADPELDLEALTGAKGPEVFGALRGMA